MNLSVLIILYSRNLTQNRGIAESSTLVKKKSTISATCHITKINQIQDVDI